MQAILLLTKGQKLVLFLFRKVQLLDDFVKPPKLSVPVNYHLEDTHRLSVKTQKRTVKLLKRSSEANKQLSIRMFAKHFHPLITKRV